MSLSLTDHLLMPIERPNCARCRIRMNLTSIAPRKDHSEIRVFECPKCSVLETRLIADPLTSKQVKRLAIYMKPPV